MKRRYIGLLAAASMLALTACNSSDEDAKTTPAPNKVVDNKAQTEEDAQQTDDNNESDDNKGTTAQELKLVVEGLVDKVTMPAMFEAPNEYVSNYFGIDKSKYPDSVFYVSQDATSVQTIILISVNDDDKETIKKGLEGYVESKKQETNNYMASEYDVACNAKIEEKGNVLYLVMSTEVDKACEYIKGAL